MTVRHDAVVPGQHTGIDVESIVIATLGAIAVVFAAGFANGSRGLRRRRGGHGQEQDMTTTESGRRSAGTRAPARLRRQLASAARRASGAITRARAGAATLIVHVPGTVRATRVGAQGATSALQTLPDSTLRWLAAGSVGLGAGLSLAGAPRLAIAAGIAPALIMGAAMVARPDQDLAGIDGDLARPRQGQRRHGENRG